MADERTPRADPPEITDDAEPRDESQAGSFDVRRVWTRYADPTNGKRPETPTPEARAPEPDAQEAPAPEVQAMDAPEPDAPMPDAPVPDAPPPDALEPDAGEAPPPRWAPPETLARIGAFGRRHRKALAAAAVLLITLGAFLLGRWTSSVGERPADEIVQVDPDAPALLGLGDPAPLPAADPERRPPIAGGGAPHATQPEELEQAALLGTAQDGAGATPSTSGDDGGTGETPGADALPEQTDDAEPSAQQAPRVAAATGSEDLPAVEAAPPGAAVANEGDAEGTDAVEETPGLLASGFALLQRLGLVDEEDEEDETDPAAREAEEAGADESAASEQDDDDREKVERAPGGSHAGIGGAAPLDAKGLGGSGGGGSTTETSLLGGTRGAPIAGATGENDRLLTSLIKRVTRALGSGGGGADEADTETDTEKPEKEPADGDSPRGGCRCG